MSPVRTFRLSALAAALLPLGSHTAMAAPFGAPFIPLPEGAAGNGGDTSAYFGMQIDANGNLIYPSPNVYGCEKSVAGGGICRTDFNNFDTRYTYNSARWRMWDGGSTGLIDSFSWKDPGMDMFRKIYFGYRFDLQAPDHVSPAFTQPINFSLYSDYSARESSHTFSLTTEALHLNQVNLKFNEARSGAANPLVLVFEGANPSINLSNSSLIGAKLLVNGSQGHFSIRALEGRNTISQAGHSVVYTPSTITVSPGAWLTLSDMEGGLEFRGKGNTIQAVGLNQDGGLALQRGNFRFESGSATFSEGAALRLIGSGTLATFDRMHFSSGANLVLENGTTLDAHTVNLKDAAARAGSGALLSAQTIQVNGSNRIDSAITGTRLGSVQTEYLGIFDGSRLELNGLYDFKVKGLTQLGLGLGKPDDRAVLSLNRASFIAYSGLDMSNGSVLSLSNLADFTLRPNKGSHEHPFSFIRASRRPGANVGPVARIEVGSDAILNVVYGGQIDINDQAMEVHIEPLGMLAVKGNLRGNGYIGGGGNVALEREGTAGGQKVSGGWLFPGTDSQPISTLSADTLLYFEQGSQLRVNVGRDAQGQLANGKVLYGAKDVIFDGTVTLALAQAPDQAPLRAADLDGRSVTMLAARDAAVTGTIRPSVFKPVVDVSAMPALLTWRMVDLQTNQHPDITLEADLLDVSQLRKHTGSKTNRASGLGLLVTVAVQNPASPITGALGTLTNAQLGASGTVTLPSDFGVTPPVPAQLPTPVQAQGTAAAQQNSWHPEPYSSFIASRLAQIANLRNMVFARAALSNPSGTQVWADTAGARGRINGQDDLGSYGYRMSQLVVGGDVGAVWGGAWGAYAGVSQQKIDEHDLQTQAISGTALALGAYWRRQGQAWTTLAQWGIARGQHDSTRQLALGAQRQELRAAYASDSMQAAVRFIAPWLAVNGIEFSHEVGGSVTLVRQAGFDETGHADLGFRVKAANAAAYIAHVGAQVRFPSLPLQQGLRPIGFARFEHDFAGNKDHAIQASLLANPQLYAQFVGQGRGANSAVVGLGLTTERPGPWQIQAGLTHAWHTHGRDWGAGMNLRYSW